MNFFDAIILSIVEGLTEFLPISSTGHLILTAKLLGVDQSNFTKTFEIAIQSGAILSVLAIYWRRLLLDKETLKRIIWAFIPTGIIGFGLYKVVKEFLIGNLQVTLVSLLFGGVFIILFEKYFKTRNGEKKISNLSIKEAVLIGVTQSIAMIPGVSRSAATILGGMGLGLSRKEAVELSFILAVPTLAAATGWDLIKNVESFNGSEINLIVWGLVGSFISGLLAVKWFLAFVKQYDLISFGIYRIIVSLLFFFFVL